MDFSGGSRCASAADHFNKYSVTPLSPASPAVSTLYNKDPRILNSQNFITNVNKLSTKINHNVCYSTSKTPSYNNILTLLTCRNNQSKYNNVESEIYYCCYVPIDLDDGEGRIGLIVEKLEGVGDSCVVFDR